MPLPNTLKTPSFIQKLLWITNPIAYLESAARQYPDIFTGEVVGFGDTVVFLSHPQAIQEVFTNDRKKFAAMGEVMKIFHPLIGENAIGMLNPEEHKVRRKILMPPFHGERVKAYEQIICEITEKVWSQLPSEEPFKASTIIKDISLQVILQAVFGLYEGKRCQQLRHLMPLLLSIFESPITSSFFMFPFLQKDFGSWSPWGNFIRLRQQVDELLYAEITERREQEFLERTDILSLLMSARDEEGKGLTDKELRDELMSLVFAGHETTATSMTWALYWIHQNLEVKQKLLQEIDSLGDYPDSKTIFKLPYLTAVCNEALRICPPTMFTASRVVQEPLELLGHKLEVGTVIQCCIYLTHHRQDLYPEPKQFKPERFLEREFSTYEFLPFGGGARSCIGGALAKLEMKLVLAKILSRYELALADSKPERIQRKGLLTGPANGVNMVITGQRARRESLMTV
jgi:cytochrome P450 family 110